MFLDDVDFRNGTVHFNHFDDIDPKIPIEEQLIHFDEDMLWVEYNDCEYGIDIGWYPSYKIDGSFWIYIIKNNDWEEPIKGEEIKDFNELKRCLLSYIDYIVERLKPIYKPLEDLSEMEINSILEKGDLNELIRLPLSVGANHYNWKYAQELCAQLCNHENATIRANAVLGFAYIARTKGMLEKHIVKPLILKELRQNKEFEWRVIDAINDINYFMKWNIGKKALNGEK